MSIVFVLGLVVEYMLTEDIMYAVIAAFAWMLIALFIVHILFPVAVFALDLAMLFLQQITTY